MAGAVTVGMAEDSLSNVITRLRDEKARELLPWGVEGALRETKIHYVGGKTSYRWVVPEETIVRVFRPSTLRRTGPTRSSAFNAELDPRPNAQGCHFPCEIPEQISLVDLGSFNR